MSPSKPLHPPECGVLNIPLTPEHLLLVSLVHCDTPVTRENYIKLAIRDLEEPSQDSELKGDTEWEKLFRAAALQPQPPCVDRGDSRPCEHFAKCAKERLACKAFFAYTRYPDDNQEYSNWIQQTRRPNRRIYAKTYKKV